MKFDIKKIVKKLPAILSGLAAAQAIIEPMGDQVDAIIPGASGYIGIAGVVGGLVTKGVVDIKRLRERAAQKEAARIAEEEELVRRVEARRRMQPPRF